jgi:hypothetical protein
MIERLLETRADGLTLGECVHACIDNADFVNQWSRLRGHPLPKNALDQEIDRATQNDRRILEMFIDDVRDLVFLRAERMDDD